MLRLGSHNNDDIEEVHFDDGDDTLENRAVLESIHPHYMAIWEVIESMFGNEMDGVQCTIVRLPDGDLKFDVELLSLEKKDVGVEE